MEFTEYLYKKYGGLMSMADVCAVLHLSINGVKAEIRRGLKYTRLGNRFKFKPEWVAEYVENRKTRAG